MITATTILAASDADNIAKLIFFVVAAVIWGIGALAKIAGQKGEQEKRKQVAASIQDAVAMRRPQARPAEKTRQRVPSYSPAAARTVKARAAKQSLPARATTPPPVPTRPAAAPAVSEVVYSLLSTAAPESKRPLSQSRPAGYTALLNPLALRQQIIVAEILQPPLALRDGGA